MAREFLTINGVNVEPTEDNIVTVTKTVTAILYPIIFVFCSFIC